MKSKNLFLAIFYCLLSLTAVETAHAQKWNKYFDKAEDKYKDGNYKKAAKKIAKAEKKARKKLGPKSPILAIALVKKAKINVGYGVLTEVEGPILEAVEMNEEVNADYKLEYGYLLKEAAEVMVLYGNYNLADQYLEKATTAFKEANVFDEIEGEIDVMKAKIMSGKGFYQKAVELVDAQTDFFRSRIAAAGKKTIDQRKEEFAEMLIVKANALRKMGDYLRSDSAFIYNKRWIDENLKKSNITYAKNALLNAQLLKENGLSMDAQAELFEDAYLQAIRKHDATHMVVMEINENLMNAYYATNSRAKLKILTKEFEKSLRDFPKNSIYNLAEELTEIYFYFADQDLVQLENKINRMLGNSTLPKNHQRRIDLLEFANEIGLLLNKHQNTETYQKRILAIKENLMGMDAPEYHMTKIKLANYYIDYADKFDEVKQIYETSFKEIVDPEITEGHIMYLDILNHLAKYYEETDQYDKAKETLDRALLAARRKYDDKDIEYGKTLEKIANLQINIGEYELAEENLKTAMNIFDDLKSDLADAYMAVALITEAELLAIKGEFDEAEDNIFDSDKIREKAAITVESSGLDYQDDLAGLYINIGLLSEAQELLENSIKDKTRQFGKESRHLNQALVLSGELNLVKGNYTEAEQIARRANNITTSIFGDQSTKTVPSTILLSKVYTTIGDYEKAEGLLQKAIAIQKEQFGNSHVDVGKSVSQLALVKYYKNDPLEQVNELFKEAENIIGQRLGSTNPTYAEILKNMAIASISAGEYNLAFSYLDNAGRIWSRRISKRNNINAAIIDGLKGDIYYRQKRYDKAEKLYEDAQKRFGKFFSDKHPEYVKIQSKLSKAYFMQENYRKSQDQMEEVLANYKDFINNYFPALSEREKAKFWNTIKTDYEFYTTLIINRNRTEKYIGELYNNALLTKALLLNSSIKIRQSIMNSNDDELKKLYSQWIEKKELLTAALSMSNEQLEEAGINTSELTNEVELLEKDLSLKSEFFSQSTNKQEVTWEKVRNSLKENEVAIEMVRFRLFDHNFTDSVMYALLYVTGEKRSKPKMILLEDGHLMEEKYLQYYRNAIRYSIKDRFSYDEFWKPIAEEIGSVSTMYISPDGVYNQINLEAIPVDENTYVLDNSNIILVSNTKDLFLNKTKSNLISDQQLAMMVGNPVFYIETSPGIPKPNSGLTRESAEVIQKLPGTKKEIEELNEYLTGKGWNIEEYTEMEASEEAVKKAENPRIFHIATHGFFQADRLEASAMDAELNENYMYENPLLKSGLLLTGAGDILNETKYNYNVDNGILTAYEAMNLNLDQTDLVVLSACETGLGEVEAGEGVYGLQRAFLVAGAKTIIMSLFKVSDEATQQLMVKFYKKWIETGDKRKAFTEAKKEIRNEYRDPIYWGPFIMIGLD